MKRDILRALFVLTAGLLLPARAQMAVVNEFRNGTPDIVELVVVSNNLNMQGFIVKDFSSSGNNDGGRAYTFSTDSLWSSLPAGTIIVLRNDNSSADTTVGGSDYNLDVGLSNTTYFTIGSGTFDIATDETIMIKTNGSPTAGIAGSIHALATATAGGGTNYAAIASPKLRASSGNSQGGESVEAQNSTASLADFDGTDALGDRTTGSIGTWNNPSNQAFILSLRGITSPPTNVQFTVASDTVGESSGSYTVTIYKTLAEGNVSGSISLGGTAEVGGGSDYTVDTTNFVMSGTTTSATFVITLNDDGDAESTETVTLTLASVIGGTIATPSTFTLSLIDNDGGGSGLLISQYTETDVSTSPKGIEVWNNSGSTINFDGSANKLDVKIGVNGAAPASVITVETGSLDAGDVLVIGTADMSPDVEQSFTFNGDDSIVLEFGGIVVDMIGVAGTDPGTAWTGGGVSTANQNIQLKEGITNGDADGWTDPSLRFETVDVGSVLTGFGTPPSGESSGSTTNVKFAVASDSVSESAGNYVVTIYKTVADGEVSGNIALGGTATVGGGADYTIDTTNFTLSGATTSATLNVTIIDDSEIESAETIVLTITNVVGGAASSPSVFTLTVSDNDAVVIPTNVQFTAASATVGEGANAYTVTVYKSLASGNVSGSVELSGTATLGGGADYTINTTNFTINGATTSATFVITINDDALVESTETVILTLANVAGGTTSSPSIFTLSITNNDAAGAIPTTNVWFNEIHYDNAGPDANEGVEIAGPAGTDLSGYSVWLYDGDSGLACYCTYSNVTLTGTIPDQSNGFGTVWFGLEYGPSGSALENGPDGLALVYGTTQVIQFLSYEGSFTASDGPAAGKTSANMGVQESSTTTPVDSSLQLCGDGTGYAAFAWSTNLPHSRGTLNACQTIPSSGSGYSAAQEDYIVAHWGSVGAYSGDTADDDNDGFLNVEEFVAGTIPVLPGGATNFFRSISVTNGASSFVIVPSVTGRLYRLWSSPTLLATQVWTAVAGPTAGTGGNLSLSDGVNTNRGVYRLSVELAP